MTMIPKTHTKKNQPQFSNPPHPIKYFQIYILNFYLFTQVVSPTKNIWPQNPTVRKTVAFVCVCGKVGLLFVRVFVLFICSFVYVCTQCLYCKYMFTFVCWFHLVNNSHTLKCTSGMVCSCANVPKEDNKNEKSFNFFPFFLSFDAFLNDCRVCVMCVRRINSIMEAPKRKSNVWYAYI